MTRLARRIVLRPAAWAMLRAEGPAVKPAARPVVAVSKVRRDRCMRGLRGARRTPNISQPGTPLLHITRPGDMLGPEGKTMKMGIIGVGAVGSAIAMAAASRARVREIVLVNRNRARAKAVATDMHYGVALSPLVSIRDGDYADLADAGLAIITAGINEKAGGATDRNDPAGRLRLLDANVKVFQDIVPKLVKAAPEAVIVVATDPPEPLADVARQLAGHDRIVDAGTYLDSLRFRLHIGERLGVAPDSVDANVVGEHGTSSVFL